MPRRLLPRVQLLADGRIEPYRLALAGKARHTDCHIWANDIGPDVWRPWVDRLRNVDDEGRHASDAKLASSKNHP